MRIKEYSNKNYKIDEIKMANDQIIKNTTPPFFQNYNFFCIIVGTPGSGKTTLLLNMINKKAKNSLYKKFDKVFIFSRSLKTITTKIKLPDEQLFDGIDELENLIEKLKSTDDRNCIIIDDCVNDIKDTNYIMQMVYNRRHISGGISLIITAQVWNRLLLPLRKCATDIIIYATNNKKELKSIFDDFINIPFENWLSLCRYVFKTNHNFLWIKNETNEFFNGFNRLELDF